MDFRVTNSDGRASNFLGWEDFKPGTYKMHFATGQYYKEKQTETFYPYAEVKLIFNRHFVYVNKQKLDLQSIRSSPAQVIGLGWLC